MQALQQPDLFNKPFVLLGNLDYQIVKLSYHKWRHIPAILAVRRPTEETKQIEDSLGYIASFRQHGLHHETLSQTNFSHLTTNQAQACLAFQMRKDQGYSGKYVGK